MKRNSRHKLVDHISHLNYLQPLDISSKALVMSPSVSLIYGKYMDFENCLLLPKKCKSLILMQVPQSDMT